MRYNTSIGSSDDEVIGPLSFATYVDVIFIVLYDMQEESDFADDELLHNWTVDDSIYEDDV